MSVPSQQVRALRPPCSSTRQLFGRGMHGRRTGSGRLTVCVMHQTAPPWSLYPRPLVTARERLPSSVQTCRWPGPSRARATFTFTALRHFHLPTTPRFRTAPLIRISRWVPTRAATPSPLYIYQTPRMLPRLRHLLGRTDGAKSLALSPNVYHSPSMTRGLTRPRSRATTLAIRSPTRPASHPSRPPPSRLPLSAPLGATRTRSTLVCRHDTNLPLIYHLSHSISLHP